MNKIQVICNKIHEVLKVKKPKRLLLIALGFVLVIGILLQFGLFTYRSCCLPKNRCTLGSFGCAKWEFASNSVTLEIVQEYSQELTYVFIELEGCESHTLHSFKPGETKRLVFNQGKCANVEERFETSINTAWTRGDNESKVLSRDGYIVN